MKSQNPCLLVMMQLLAILLEKQWKNQKGLLLLVMKLLVPIELLFRHLVFHNHFQQEESHHSGLTQHLQWKLH